MASNNASNPKMSENQSLSAIQFRERLQTNKKYKARSHNTYHDIHLPELTFHPDEPINTVLVGDSMLERLKTTGLSTKIAQLSSSFNAGVGGDKIENVLYRFDLGMLSLLEGRNVKLWVVMVGTNNLRKALKPAEIESYRLLLQALLRTSPTSRIIVCELFMRKDIDDKYVVESNKLLQELIKTMSENIGENKICWLGAPTAITKDHLDDHVHLNEEGYRIWGDELFPCIEMISNQHDP